MATFVTGLEGKEPVETAPGTFWPSAVTSQIPIQLQHLICKIKFSFKKWGRGRKNQLKEKSEGSCKISLGIGEAQRSYWRTHDDLLWGHAPALVDFCHTPPADAEARHKAEVTCVLGCEACQPNAVMEACTQALPVARTATGLSCRAALPQLRNEWEGPGT